MSCLPINLTKHKAFDALEKQCGGNTELMTRVYNAVVSSITADDSLIPDFAFRQWYMENYGEEPNFNKGTGAQMRDRMLRYVDQMKDLNSTASAKNTRTHAILAEYGYTSPTARRLAKRLVANQVISIYYQVERELKQDSEEYEGIELDRAVIVANGIVNTSDLSASAKNKLYEQIRDAEDIDSVKEILRNAGLRYKFRTEEGNKRYFFGIAKDMFLEHLIDRIEKRTNLSREEIEDSILNKKRAWVEEVLGGEEMSIPDANLIATYYEFDGNFNRFVEETLLDSRLGDLRFVKEESLGDEQEVQAIDGNADLNDENTPEDENPTENDTDAPVTIALYDHSGTYTTALTHINKDIKNYLNSLRKLKSKEKLSDGKPDYDLNNELGLPDTMNANECATMLYHYGDFSSVEAMIASIKYIAETKPGFEAFWTLAQDLENNLDFAYSVKRTFGKVVIAKLETRIRDGQYTCKIANTRSDRLSELGAEYMNSVKVTAVTNSTVYMTNELAKLREFVEDETTNILSDRNNPSRKEAVARIAKLLRNYYTTINDYSVENFINLNRDEDGSVNVSDNIAKLLTVLEDTITESNKTQSEYRNHQREIGSAISHNDKKRQEAVEQNKFKAKDLIDLGLIYAKEFVPESQLNVAVRLAGYLAEYSVVSLDLNSTNVLGNQSSDVINDSFLTNLRNILQNDQALDNYGQYKFRSRQYENSTILLEHRDEKNRIINRGLFRREEDGTIVPTDYAKSMLDVALYGGASNDDTDDAALYNQMSRGDYIGTAYINYFHARSRVSGSKDKIEQAAYFMRTPSDAPRNFAIYAPKYSISGLFSIANQADVDAYKTEERAKIQGTPISKDDQRVKSSQYIKVDRINSVVSHLVRREDISVRIPDFKLNKFKDGATVTVVLYYPEYDENGNEKEEVNANRYVVTGTVQGNYIVNGKFEGIVENNLSTDVNNYLDDYLQKQLEKSNRIRYNINTKHNVFKMFKGVLKQELLDAAIALNMLFVTDANGVVTRDANGEVIWKPGMSNDGNAINGAFANYHHKGGKIIVKENNRDALVGNVFHSDRFIVFDEENNEAINYGERIIKRAFDFLYGGASEKYLKVVKDENGNVIDVILNNEQQAIIDEELSNFLNHYVENASNRLYQVEDAIRGKRLSHENIADFILNYHLAYVGFNDLFEGDTKFYKNPQDFLKRAKESQGSGTSYGFADYRLVEDDRRVVASRLNSEVFAGNKRVEQFSHFRGITIKNTVKTKKETLERLVQKLMDTGLSEADARTLMYGPEDKKKGKPIKNFDGTITLRAGGYQGTTVNDAQSYITFDEWVRRVAGRGQLTQYRDLINKVYAGEKLTADDLSEFIQVQKNFYYDQHYNEQAGVFNPRQIKNAEFVLVPQLIEGTELEVVAKLMEEYGIDQLNTEETSKAGKTNVLEIFDAKTGHVKQDIIDQFVNDGPVSEFGQKVGTPEFYNYNYLYTQQETPQHMNAENKAGIQIMKKIVDNIPNDTKHPLYKQRTKLFQAYCANIKGSFVDFMQELGIKTQSDGTIKFDDDGNVLDEEGNIQNIDYKVLADRLKEEMARLGLNSNLMDYCTLDNTPIIDGMPQFKMPSYHSNVAQKFENIAQSLFNRRITRQKLPGFHAAQITNVGWSTYKDYKDAVGPSYAKELRYHPEENGKVQPYIEVLLPAGNFGFKRTRPDGTLKTDEELLKELQEAGLDEIIGYRIPTEGKQSVCRMKVVGFVPDAFGSTIVVPDEWVAQTGSDFDIDSVYGIQYNSYIDSKGHIRKVKYQETFDEYDWMDYIQRQKGVEADIKKLNEELREIRREKLHEAEKKLWDKLDESTKIAIKSIHAIIAEQIKDENAREKYLTNLANESALLENRLETIKEDYTEEELNAIREYKEIVDYLYNSIDNNRVKLSSIKSEALSKALSEIKQERVNKYTSLAKDKNLPSFESFKVQAESNPAEYNTKEARNSGILDAMMEILGSDEMLEENLGRSNFDHIQHGLDNMSETEKLKRQTRSPYSFLDQADFQEDTMSGAKLKGFSVSRDNFCSVCNNARPTISDEFRIRVAYDSSVISYKKAVERFGKENVEEKDGKIIIYHNKFGWSEDNKNVVGHILTSYSSETTAHILDAVKAGFVPNVNDITFGVYKLFPDLGIDYDTAIDFMRQNGVTRIVDAYNRSNSIYQTEYRNPINAAIQDIYKELGGKNELASVKDIIKELKEKYNGRFKAIFGEDAEITQDKTALSAIPFNGEQLHNNLEHPFTDNIDQLLYDLGIVLQYERLSDLASRVTSAAMVLNPDKFGAKQTIFATNKIFDDIKDLISGEKPLPFAVEREGDSINLLEAVYPGVSEGFDSFLSSPVKESVYPPLYYFLKFSTAPSIKINRTLSITQSPDFIESAKHLQTCFADNARLTEKQYKDYEKYIIGWYFQDCDNIVLPIGWTKRGGISSFVPAVPEGATPEILEAYKKEERARIFGFNAKPGVTRTVVHTETIKNEQGVDEVVEVEDEEPFEVANVHKPTAEEIAEFCKFSPAQKVEWIRQHSDDAGIFAYITPTLYNTTSMRGRAGMQTLSFSDTSLDIEEAFALFEQAFCNNNPLIALTAYDVIKYAYVVEGFKMRKNAVNSCIPNSVLYNDFGEFGTGVITALNGAIRSINGETIDNHNIEEDYIRSHYSSIKQIPSMRVVKTRTGFDLSRHRGVIQIGHSDVGLKLARKYKLVRSEEDGVITDINPYVKLRFPGEEETLYKVIYRPTGLYLYPLNKLEENEHGEFSANPLNWKHASPDFYLKAIDDFEAANSSWSSEGFNNAINALDINQYKPEPIEKAKKLNLAKDLDIENPPANMVGSVDHLKKAVAEHFSQSNPKSTLYHVNLGLSRYITHSGPVNGLTKTITYKDEDGNTQAVTVDITRIGWKTVADLAKTYLGKNNFQTGAIKKGHERYRDLIEMWWRNGITNPTATDTFIIERHVEREPKSGIRRSSRVEGPEAAASFYKAMERRRFADDPDAALASRRLRSQDIMPNKDAMLKKDSMVETCKATAEYVTRVAERTLNDLRYFVKDPNSADWLSVTDKGVGNLIRNDAQLRRRYVKTILDAEAIVDNFGLITRMDIKSEDPDIQNSLKIIRDRVNDLQNDNTIASAKELLADEYLAKISTNPLVQKDILNIVDGYHSTNGFTAWIGDLQETTNPLIQILSKDVIADITAKEMEGKALIRAFRQFMREAKKNAVAKGMSINWSHLVDDFGRWIQDYTSKFLDDREELESAIYDAKAQYGACSEEHLRAKLAYEKWKVKHVNQQLEDEYYIRRNQADEKMLENAPKIFVRYNQLRHQIWEINTHRVNGVLEPSLAEKLRELKLQLDNLTSDYIKVLNEDGTITYHPKENPGEAGPTSYRTQEEKDEAIINSRNSYLALREYINEIRTLNEEFFDYENELGFDEELERNLKIIENAERRQFGRITAPASELAENPEYVRAKEWIRLNTYQIVSFKDSAIEGKIRETLKRLRKDKAASVMWRIVKDKEAFVNGVIDATKLSDEDIEAIRNEQMKDMDYHEERPFSDKNLIKNASPDNTYYTAEFYNSIRTQGIENKEWLNIVHKINELLLPYYDTAAKKIRWELIPNNEEGLKVLNKLNLLYSDLSGTSRRTGGGRANRLAFKFMKENVDTSLSEDEQKEFDAAEAAARTIGGAYFTAWNNVNYAIDENTGERVPNPYIWGSIKPKAEVREKYIDKQRTEDMKFLNDIYEQAPSEYYFEKMREMQAKGKAEYDAWVKANHIYNPYTHAYEPIKCWMTRQYKEGVDVTIDYSPSFNQTHRKVNENRVNPEYKPNLGHALNYKKGSNPEYDNNVQLNEFEQQIKDYCQDMLDKLVRNAQDRDFIARGYLPSSRKGEEHDARFWGKELLKTMGWIDGHSGKEPLYEDLSYSRDRTPSMPMLNLFDQKRLKDLNVKKPVREDYEDEKAYDAAMQEYEEKRKKLKADNAKAHADAISHNWEAVLEDFITEATHFNAVQDNKYMLFYGKSMLDNLEVYQRKYGFFGDYKTDRLNTTESETEYIKRRDDNLRKQYENWIRRIIYGQWKEPNAKFTKWASRLQSLTSAQYMMLNVRGGIANITLGETQILAEAFAAEYFGVKDWAKGKAMWTSGIPSYFARLYSETSLSLPDAIIKWFNVVDYDEVTGKCRIVEDPVSTGLNRFRSAMFSTLTVGENLMQNGALFSMLMSHRLYEIPNPDYETNPDASPTKLVFKNLREATRDAEFDALKKVLKDRPELQRKFDKVVETIKKDANKVKDFAWFRRDLTYDFATQFLSNEERKELLKLRKQYVKEATDEFNNDEQHPTVLSQLELGKDEQMSIKADSILGRKYNVAKKDGSPTDAYRFLAEFRGRVISVNKKIHGIYNKLGQAQLEKTWYGSLVMQYHKHMYPGILKRWRKEGYYNEERGTIEKGSYVALWDFLKIPFRDNKDLLGMTDAEVEGMEGIQNVFKRVIDFWLNIRLNWGLLPDYEKDNIARNLGDLCGIVSAVFMAVALRVIADDDDKKNGILWHLAIYEADRLASESFQFNPLGMYGEAKKLWSTPIAAQSGIQDLLQSCGLLAHMLMEGEDFDPYYHSGRFAGEHKLSVYIQRRIPIWRGIKTGFIDIVDSNSYYKLTQNMLGFIDAPAIAKWIKD